MSIQTSSQSTTSYMQEQSRVIHRQLEQLMASDPTAYASLYTAASYSLLSGGKRLRPILVLASTEALGGDANAALIPACALEMIHTYSMIHDDLPCMDNDDFRRGKPTLHRVYDEAVALLAGDLLLTYPFELLAEAPDLSIEQRLELIRLLARASGGHGMIGGQVMDIQQKAECMTDRSLEAMHRRKTGALLTAALEFGAVIAQATSEIRQQLTLFGQNIGLAYQIIDDVLDITASEHKHGRKIASDHLNGKKTYATLLGVPQAKQKAETLLKQSLEILNGLALKTCHLQELAKLLVYREI